MVYSSLKLRAVLSFDLAEDILSPRARCNNCGVKGSDTYQKVDTGNSDSAMDGARVKVRLVLVETPKLGCNGNLMRVLIRLTATKYRLRQAVQQAL